MDPKTTTFKHGDYEFEVRLIGKKEKLQCPIGKCRKRWDDENSLTHHISEAHNLTVEETRECPVCSETFKTRQTTSKTYCSISCAQEAQKENAGNSKVEHICEECGETFMAYESRERKYCSRECVNLSNRQTVKRPCHNCDEYFETTPSDDEIYCSRECYHENTGADRDYHQEVDA